ncbi:type II toxin-antitoxin system HicA family toxin [Cellulosimicrobium composti]|uniref:type II toxin-antitoxin system HicA family toxin n=1 Tax=Cellulosimicrobium composti TaxID=2672572 RepID=UPI003798E732
MRRTELIKRIGKMAKTQGVEVVYTEGGSHTKVRLGDRQTVIPRHNEINEHTARAILKHLEGEGK